MADNTSTTTFRADISSLQRGMQQAARQVRLAESEFRAATAGMDDWSQSADGLRAKLRSLDGVLDAQRRKLSILEDELERTEREYGQNSAAAERVRIRINNQTAAIERTEREIRQYNTQLESATRDTVSFDDAIEDLNRSTNDSSSGFTIMKDAIGDLVADGIRMAIDAVKELAEETLRVGASFEQGMAQVGAISGASAEEMEILNQKAKEMGETTKFSATEASEAFGYMAMAGWETEDMIEGIGGIMNLAAASGEDLARTSDIVTDALTAMGYSAGDAGKLADVMAAASSNANTNVSLMGSTFQYAAPLLGALGMSMEDAAVAIGLMANAGIKGDKAGTALRSTLSRLSAPPKECAEEMDKLGVSLTDSDGKMKTLDEIIRDLRSSFSELSEEEQTSAAKHIAGQEAMSGLLAIVNATEADYNKLTEAVNNSAGAAEAMAETMNDTVQGQATLIKSKVEGIMIKIFERVAPVIRDSMEKASAALDKVDWDKVADKVAGFFGKIKDLYNFIKQNSGTIKGLIAGVIAAFAVTKIASIISAIASMVTTVRNLTVAIQAASSATEVFTALQAATPIGLVTTALALLVGGLTAYTVATKDAAEKTDMLSEKERGLVDSIDEEAESYKNLKKERNEAADGAAAEFEYYRELAGELDGIVDANGKVKKGYEDRADFIVTTLNDALGMEMELTDGVIEKYKKQKDEIYKLIEAKKAEAVMGANEALYTEAVQNRYEIFTKMEQAQDAYASAVGKTEKAERDFLKAQKAYEDARESGADVTAIMDYRNKLEEAQAVVDGAKKKQNELKKAYDDSKGTYEGYIRTIENYEGTAEAVLSGDTEKIVESLEKLQNGFISAETGNRESLERQLENYKKMNSDYKKAIEDGTPGVTQAMVDQSEELVKMAEEELKKLPPEAEKEGKKSGTYYAVGIGSKSEEAKKQGSAVGESAKSGVSSQNEPIGQDGVQAGANYASGIGSQAGQANASGQNVASSAKSGLDSQTEYTRQSGVNFARGFANGINEMAEEVGRAAASVAQNAIDQVRKKQKEASPSKVTYKSGENFTKGYVNGILSGADAVEIASSHIASLATANLENSSVGVNFFKKFIDSIGQEEKGLEKSVKKMGTALLKSFFSPAQYGASFGTALNAFEDSFNKKITKVADKFAYKNNQKLESLDAKIQKMESDEEKALSESQKESEEAVKKLKSQRDKEVKRLEIQKKNADDKETKSNIERSIKNIKKYYNAQISEQEKASKKQSAAIKKEYDKRIKTQKEFYDSYQTASEAMLSELTDALSSYQAAASDLITSTIDGIYNAYEQKYDSLMQKQENLFDKLTTAKDLFDVSGAGVMTIGDLAEQTDEIVRYTDKLALIKGKVSEGLFDQIVQYDMKQGTAFMDRLLSMSEIELKAYSDAYNKKIEAAQKASSSIYSEDLKNAEEQYRKELSDALGKLPAQLEDLGKQAMKGFVDGLTSDTDYMTSGIRKIINQMVNEFKKELDIHSPSRVMEKIGSLTGEGLADGIAGMAAEVKASVRKLADAASVPISGVDLNYGSIVGKGVDVGSRTEIVNNYNLVQNNTSPKALTALETYQARRQQIAMLRVAALQ